MDTDGVHSNHVKLRKSMEFKNTYSKICRGDFLKVLKSPKHNMVSLLKCY